MEARIKRRENIITRRTTRAHKRVSILLHLNIYFFDLIRNNVARRARVDRLRCHDEAFLAATVLGSVKGVCSARKQEEVEEQDERGRFGSEGGARMFAQGFGRARAIVDTRKRERKDRVYRVRKGACVYVYVCTCARVYERDRRFGERKRNGEGRERKGKTREFACAPVCTRET